MDYISRKCEGNIAWGQIEWGGAGCRGRVEEKKTAIDRLLVVRSGLFLADSGRPNPCPDPNQKTVISTNMPEMHFKGLLFAIFIFAILYCCKFL